MPTIFTRIINQEIPSYKIYEDNLCYAFLDINPITKGHTLLVPKEEYLWMKDTPDEIISHLFIVAKKLMNRMIEKLEVDYVQLMVEGLEVPHFHIHLIPAKRDQKVMQVNHTLYDNSEAEKIMKQLSVDVSNK